MLKKITLLSLALLLLTAPFAHAQDSSRLVIDLSATFTVQDLGFTFPYPEGWILDTSTGIRLAETDADIAAASDDDPTTHAEGFTLRVLAAPIEALGEPDATLDDLVATITEIAGITVQEQAEFPVMSRRSITFSGVDGDGEAGILSAWLQDDYFVTLAMGIPESIGLNSDVFYTWGFLLAQTEMITDVEETLAFEFPFLDGTLINHPADWVGAFGDYGMIITTNAGDLAHFENDDPPDSIEDTLLFFITQEMDASQAELTAQQAFDNLIASQSFLNPTHISEHIIFDVPAISFWAEDGTSGFPMTVVTGVVENQFYIFYIQSPTEEAREAYFPILLNMLNSIRPVS